MGAVDDVARLVLFFCSVCMLCSDGGRPADGEQKHTVPYCVCLLLLMIIIGIISFSCTCTNIVLHDEVRSSTYSTRVGSVATSAISGRSVPSSAINARAGRLCLWKTVDWSITALASFENRRNYSFRFSKNKKIYKDI